MKHETKIVFIGTPKFGAIILEKLIENSYKPTLVITAPDKPAGRKQILTPPPVKLIAKKYSLSLLQPKKILNSKSKISNSKPELIVVAGYGQILPKEILDIPKYGCLNIHPSLLPSHRGSSPIQTAILNGDKKSGATIVLMDEKMDHGPILNQRAIAIEADDTAESLHNKLANLGGQLLMETIPKWQKGLIKPQPQDETKATYTKILKREDGRINWKKTAEVIHREVKAFYPWPGSYTFWERKSGWIRTGKELLKIKILKTRILKSPVGVTYPIGKTLVAPQNAICVQCGRGFLFRSGNFLVVERLQLEGKKEITSEEFLRGHPDFIGTTLK